MLCISAYEYVIGEAKMTKIFAVYLQASGFPISRRKMISSAAEQIGRHGISLSYSSPDVDFVAFFV